MYLPSIKTLFYSFSRTIRVCLLHENSKSVRHLHPPFRTGERPDYTLFFLVSSDHDALVITEGASSIIPSGVISPPLTYQTSP